MDTTTTTTNSEEEKPSSVSLDFEGKSVSVRCAELGIFQGVIKFISSEKLTIVRAFRNGVPLKSRLAEVTLYARDIQKIEFIPADNIRSSISDISDYEMCPQQKIVTNGSAERQTPQIDDSPPLSSNVAAFFNMIPLKVETQLGKISLKNEQMQPPPQQQQQQQFPQKKHTQENNKFPQMPLQNLSGNIKMNKTANANLNMNGSNGRMNGLKATGNNGRKQSRQNYQTFGTAADDPSILNEEFDFESNLALFDKQAVWDDIEQSKQSVEEQTDQSKQKKRNNTYNNTKVLKYRHDENILESLPNSKDDMECVFPSTSTFVTDEGTIIPTIPLNVRAQIERSAHEAGLHLNRQIDMLARSATEIAIMLLGGARRLTINNSHQWPKIVIICGKSKYYRSTSIGAATGRQLASQGLKVFLFTEEDESVEPNISELYLYKATGNKIYYDMKDLPSSDLVILATSRNELPANISNWLNVSRASTMAIDPSPGGIIGANVKYAIIPILPLNGTNPDQCGKIFLCNMGIPDKYYRDAGIKYKSPFGHKFVIPLYLKD